MALKLSKEKKTKLIPLIDSLIEKCGGPGSGVPGPCPAGGAGSGGKKSQKLPKGWESKLAGGGAVDTPHGLTGEEFRKVLKSTKVNNSDRDVGVGIARNGIDTDKVALQRIGTSWKDKGNFQGENQAGETVHFSAADIRRIWSAPD